MSADARVASACQQRDARIRAPPSLSGVGRKNTRGKSRLDLADLRDSHSDVTKPRRDMPDRLYNMSKKFPQYADPSIIKLVRGVQFDSIPEFTTGHSGWFWREYLGDAWKVSEGQLVPEQTEVFSGLVPNRMAFQLSQNPASRLMLGHVAGIGYFKFNTTDSITTGGRKM